MAGSQALRAGGDLNPGLTSPNPTQSSSLKRLEGSSTYLWHNNHIFTQPGPPPYIALPPPFFLPTSYLHHLLNVLAYNRLVRLGFGHRCPLLNDDWLGGRSGRCRAGRLEQRYQTSRWSPGKGQWLLQQRQLQVLQGGATDRRTSPLLPMITSLIFHLLCAYLYPAFLSNRKPEPFTMFSTTSVLSLQPPCEVGGEKDSVCVCLCPRSACASFHNSAKI